MDHVVYLDSTAKELDLLLSGKKTMIIRGATGRKMPHGRVYPDDTLYLINNNAEGLILAKARVKSVINSEKNDRRRIDRVDRKPSGPAPAYQKTN